MGNVLKRNHTKTSLLNHSLSHGLYKKKSKSFSKLNETKAVNLEENKDVEETNSWTTTIGTRSAFSVSYPTDDNERSVDEESTTSQDDCILSSSNYNRRSSTTNDSISNTSSDFSSFKNLSEISKHTIMHPRPEDIEWMKDVRQYHEHEPVFRKKPFKAALKIRRRRIFPRLKWCRLYHQWALRQTPKAYKGRDVLNPYINRALDVDLKSSDLEHGIFYLKCTNC
ncbi:unnamed protein product [Cercopithifilaria johnstoni]|uniref:Uncharacterized protein n=1 Tax=Cercopithifilaria johnstoni TaxID=2874296 RepID=A0A8J2M017_9BILA|nr:unnamed protein product [Cercopithifilaria johnstoni]